MLKLLRLVPLYLMVSAVALAQTATILGTVTDPTGSVVPAANVTITNLANGSRRVLQTNSAGTYVAPELTIGAYSLRAEAAGFKAYERTGIRLDSNDTVRVDAVFEVGQVSESVIIAADTV